MGVRLNLSRFLPLAGLASACLGLASLAITLPAHAQSASSCPTLPANSGLEWQVLDGPDFIFCKALRVSDGAEYFAVTLSKKSPFDPKRGNRVASTVIDGHEVYWYKSELATAPGAQVRETLVKVDDDHVAHISVRAPSDQQLVDAMQKVERIRFGTTQLSSN